MKAPVAEKGAICPLHRKDVSKVCHTCPWYTCVRGSDPQSGKEVDDWQCAIAWLPMLTIETSKNVRGNQAATESMRNEIVKRMDEPRPMSIEQAPPRVVKLVGDK